MADSLELFESGRLYFRSFVHLWLAAFVTLPVALLVLRAYRAGIRRWMRVPSSVPPPLAPPPLPVAPGPPLALKWIHAPLAQPPSPAARAWTSAARAGARHSALLYGTAGLFHAATTTALFLTAGHYPFGPTTAAAFFLVLAWPATLLIGKIALARRALRWLVPSLLALAIVLFAGSHLDLMITIWLVYVAPPLLLILCVSERRFRTAGLLVFPTLFLVLTLTRHTAMAGASWGAILAVLALSTLLALGSLAALAWLHERKAISESAFVLDAEWLFLSVWQAFCFAVHVGHLTALGLLPFLVYKLTTLLGRRLTRPATAAPNCTLLLLRTFGARTRSEGLLDQLGTTWRWIGSIQLIGAPDVAGAYLEPRDFLALLTGRLARLFVQDEPSLLRRLAHLDLRPDPDGRFRVNACFCFTRIWREAVQRLAGETKAVLMDLRAFTQRRQGCIEELSILMDRVPLERVVFLVDDSTDRPGLERAIQHAWTNRSASSPNRSGAAGLTVFVASRRNDASSGILLDLLSRAAASQSPH